jgi:hypothetical protein
VLLTGGVERAEPAGAGVREDDLGALLDLVQRDLLALRLVDEVLRVVHEHGRRWIARLHAGLVAGDEAVDRRNALAADDADDVLAVRVPAGRGDPLLHDEARQVPDQVAALLLPEEKALDVVGRVLEGRLIDVDDRELRLRELDRDRVDGVGHQETDADHEVVALLGEAREIGDVIRVRLRQQHPAVDAELALGALEAPVGELVEATVVEAADVGHEADLEAVPGGGSGRRRGR